MDPLAVRKQYGHDLLLIGGIDKRVLAQDKRAIEAELYAKLPPLLEDGGYIPTVDHTVPPDVSYENFCYYMELKQKLLAGRYGV
jgi:uroporphyrinogen decarboxylase